MIIILKGTVAEVREWQNNILGDIKNDYHTLISEIKTFKRTVTDDKDREYEMVTQEIVITNNTTDVKDIPF